MEGRDQLWASLKNIGLGLTLVIYNIPYVYTCFMRNKMPHIYGWLGLCHGPHLGSVPKALDGWGFATDPTWEVPQKLRRLGLSHGPHLGNLQHFLSSSWWGVGCWFPLQEFHPPLSALQASGPKRPALLFWTN